MQDNKDNIFFNAHHSPIGAFASFTLGFPGRSGGLGMELAKPADQDVYIGLESQQENRFAAFPFYEGFKDDRQNFGLKGEQQKAVVLDSYSMKDIKRCLNIASDSWVCDDLSFTVYNPVLSIPDPLKCDTKELKFVLAPCVLVELSVDNSQCSKHRKAFFGFRGNDPYTGMRRLEDSTDGTLIGISQGRRYAIATNAPPATSGLGFSMEDILAVKLPQNVSFGLGTVGAVILDVPPEEIKTFRFAICFYNSDIATSGRDTSYYYTKLFWSIEEVAQFALDHFDQYVNSALRVNNALDEAPLSQDQKFMLAHAVRSYYGSTQLLEAEGKPIWVVNEGEYRMMNTLDLTADQLFYETTMNPWTVRNVLDTFLERYSYRDSLHLPGDSTEYPGGLSFTHDMGIANVFWKQGHSSYEQSGLTGCFSHMTHEELVNWVCCACAYSEHSQDRSWLSKRLNVFEQCLDSLIHRDHPDPALRNGIMGLDSSRCMGGNEITTYDSLDASLGQARNNVYLGIKTFGAYLCLERVFYSHKSNDLAQKASRQARLCADTIVSHMTEDGYIPAIIEENIHSRIIPVIEGLAFAYFAGCKKEIALNGRFAKLLSALKNHLETVLVKGVCLFEDGGWKISSSSNNSWLSKIYLCQFVARHILKMDNDAITGTADRVHKHWLLDPKLSYWCWSDQIVNGKIQASKYYPRGVSSILWLFENAANQPYKNPFVSDGRKLM